MKKILISKNGYNCKANLGSYTTQTLGKLTAEELKSEYKKRGYSAIAFSDYDTVINNISIADNDFLPITSYKTSIENYHFTLYSKTPDNTRVEIPQGNFGDIQDKVNAFIDAANQKGYLVCIDHPAKSMQTYADFDKLTGYFGIAVTDYASVVEGHIEDNNHIVDRILRGGNKVHIMAADSNRNEYSFDHPHSDSFGAFAMINAKSNDYGDVLTAIENGEFYVSTGPTIQEVSVEGIKVKVKCSPVKYIRLLNAGRDAVMMIAIAPEGEYITEAEFEVTDKKYCGGYVRVDVRDEYGDFADSQVYYLDDILGE